MKNLTQSDKSQIKNLAILFHAQTIKYNGRVYKVPSGWKKIYKGALT